LPAHQRTNIPVFLTLPQEKGGYLILSEFAKDGTSEILKGRRYIKVGEVEKLWVTRKMTGIFSRV
jgi:hypothetical protein